MEEENNNNYQVLQDKVDDIKATVISNIDKLVERNNTIDHVLYDTNTLVDSSISFKHSTRQLKYQLCRKKIITSVGIVLSGLIVGFIIIMSFCGINFLKCG